MFRSILSGQPACVPGTCGTAQRAFISKNAQGMTRRGWDRGSQAAAGSARAADAVASGRAAVPGLARTRSILAGRAGSSSAHDSSACCISIGPSQGASWSACDAERKGRARQTPRPREPSSPAAATVPVRTRPLLFLPHPFCHSTHRT